MGEAWITADIEMVFQDVEAARIVFQAIDPDNKPLPQGLEIEAVQVDRVIHIAISCSRPLQSFLATLDDILKMARLAEETVALVRKP
ncbi:hypothetical protein HRbin01_01710 [archaeon HR01]|mgnify:CR=1 FL=1|nr:hypothetical protein HRbin01_01710 [archaeon HR01]